MISIPNPAGASSEGGNEGKPNADRKRNMKAYQKQESKLKVGQQFSEVSAVEESKILPQNEDDRISEKSKKDAEVEDEQEESVKSGEKGGKEEPGASTTIKIDKPKDKPAATKPRRWERRWIMQPNVLDLNKGEIWVQKWVTVDSAKESRETIEKIINELEEAEKQLAFA